MKQYLSLLRDVLENGEPRVERTGVGTVAVFGRTLRFDLTEGFPLVTTKKMFWSGIIDELYWILSGSTNINDLPERTRKWWTPWATESGDLGPIYGKQLRDFDGVDQLEYITGLIKTNPTSRRILYTLWNPGELKEMKLPPCHGIVVQFYITNENKLSLQVYCRSQDVFVGTPVNIASYALLCHLVANWCELEVGELIWIGGDVHLYSSHLETAKLQLSRLPYLLPGLRITKEGEVLLTNYSYHPPIKVEVAV